MTIKMIENERCCGNCRFYDPEGRNCRRFPPQVWETVETGGSAFPRVETDEWCGEFQGIEKGWVIPEGFVLIDPQDQAILEQNNADSNR